MIDAEKAALEGFMMGDALGMPTEFMTRKEIHEKFGLIDRLLEPHESKNHSDLKQGQVTDDTEQVMALLDEYCIQGRISAYDTAYRLLRWMKESGAVEKRYIGPSSKVALEAIEAGADPNTTGLRGTTCGGVMRCPSAALFALARNASLEKSVHACLLPTHNTKPALEAGMGYAFALRAALLGENLDTILAALEEGAEKGARLAPYDYCSPSLVARVEHFKSISSRFAGPDDVLDFLYNVYGASLESIDVASAAICIFLYAAEDTWLSIRMGASLGGDTDTVAALAGALSAAYCSSRGKNLNIPGELLDKVIKVNGIDISKVAVRLNCSLMAQ
ncbi:MAG: ADP-ribosylglycohydrolase family protein [Spirochaetota bacterium]|jgi:ADP-ribosylglycohydrolase